MGGLCSVLSPLCATSSMKIGPSARGACDETMLAGCICADVSASPHGWAHRHDSDQLFFAKGLLEENCCCGRAAPYRSAFGAVRAVVALWPIQSLVSFSFVAHALSINAFASDLILRDVAAAMSVVWGKRRG